MKITISRENEVDFAAPIWMSEAQQKKFAAFMKRMFPGIEVDEDVEEPYRKGIGHTGENKPWLARDYEKLLLSVLEGKMSEEEIARHIKRSSMSIIQKIGVVYPEYLRWEKKHKESEDIESNIKKFVKEKFGEDK